MSKFLDSYGLGILWSRMKQYVTNSTVADAPSDNNQYVRQNGSWQQVQIPEGGAGDMSIDLSPIYDFLDEEGDYDNNYNLYYNNAPDELVAIFNTALENKCVNYNGHVGRIEYNKDVPKIVITVFSNTLNDTNDEHWTHISKYCCNTSTKRIWYASGYYRIITNGNGTQFLSNDGYYKSIPTPSLATTTSDGLMSSGDKSKLDEIKNDLYGENAIFYTKTEIDTMYSGVNTILEEILS